MGRYAKYCVVLILWGSWTARGDAAFERAQEALAVVDALASAIQNGNADRFVNLFLPGATLFHRGGSVRDPAGLKAFFNARFQNGTPIRIQRQVVVLDDGALWTFFTWTTDQKNGATALLLKRLDLQWKIAVADLDGQTLERPAPDFDPQPAAHVFAEPLQTMRSAAIALKANDQATLGRLLDAENFLFVDALGREWQGPGALIQMAFAQIPPGIDEDQMRLFVAPGTGRAVAFQPLSDGTVSLELHRTETGWKIQAASLSRPLDVLDVRPGGLLPTRWAELRTLGAD